MGKFYISAPVDEVLLTEKVAPTVENLKGTLPSSEYLRVLSERHGLDFATMVLYQAIHAAPMHQSFINSVNSEPIVTQQPASNVKILVIPALFYKHFPETGADAKFAGDIACQCGFDVDTIQIRSVAPCSENALIINETLEREKAEQIWIFSVSKGSADFRTFLQLYPENKTISRIRGWINVCGIAQGCQISDYNTNTAWRRLKYRVICRLLGTGFNLMTELRTDHQYWSRPMSLPPHMKIFNFSAIPLGSHIQTSLIGRYKALSPQGPNDGMVLCRDSMFDQGPIYPVWGCDHFFRNPQIIPLLYRFFGFLKKQC